MIEAASARGLGYCIRPLKSEGEIVACLRSERFYAAYALGDLELPLGRSARWYLAEGDGQFGLAMHCPSLRPGWVFCLGGPAGVEAILDQALKPWFATFHCLPQHLEGLARLYHIRQTYELLRMRVSRATFRPAGDGARRLGPKDIPWMHSLYQGNVAPLDQRHMAQAIYYGVYRDGALVAAAGTHFLSRRFSLAAVGNVFTHPSHRNRGFATACTSAVTADCLELCQDVVLNVHSDNHPARAVYDKMGYESYCTYKEVQGERRAGSRLQGIVSRLFWGQAPPSPG